MTGSSTTPSPSPQRTTRLFSPLLLTLTAATFWTVTVELLPSGLLPAMSRDLGVPEQAIGALVGSWAITIAVVGIPLVRLTRRVPAAVLLPAALATTAIATLVTALAPVFAVAAVGRVLGAAAHGLFWALVVSYVATVVDAARLGRALAVVLAGPTLAGLVALPAATALGDVAGWRVVFAALAVLTGSTAVALWLVLRRASGAMPARRRGRKPDRETATETAGRWDRSARRVLAVAAGGGLVLVGHFAAFTYVTALVARLGGLGDGGAPLVLLLLGATGAVGVAVSGILSDRLPFTALVGTPALIAVGLAGMLLGDQRPAVFLAGAAVWGFAIGAFPPVLQARVLRVSSAGFRPVAGSIVVTVLNLGIAAGAALGGAALGAGTEAVVLGAAIAAAAGAVLLGAAYRGAEQHEPVRRKTLT